MDESTKNQIKNDIRRGYDPAMAGERAGLDRAYARYQGERLEREVREEDSARLNELLFSGGKSSSEPLPPGFAGVLILIALGAVYFSTIVSIVLLVATLILIAATFIPAALGRFPLTLAAWTLLGTASLAAIVYLVRGGAAATGVPSLGVIDLPAFATGAPTTDALAIGLWLTLLFGLVPSLRRRLLSWIGRFALPPVVGVFVAVGKSALPLRMAGLLLFAVLMAVAATSLLSWPDTSWLVRSLMIYAVAVMVNGAFWCWKFTSSAEQVMGMMHHLQPQKSLAAFNQSVFKEFLEADRLEDRYRLERSLVRDSSRLYSWVFAVDRVDGLIVNPTFLDDRRLAGKTPEDRIMQASVYAFHDSLQTRAEKDAFADLARKKGIII